MVRCDVGLLTDPWSSPIARCAAACAWVVRRSARGSSRALRSNASSRLTQRGGKRETVCSPVDTMVWATLDESSLCRPRGSGPQLGRGEAEW